MVRLDPIISQSEKTPSDKREVNTIDLMRLDFNLSGGGGGGVTEGEVGRGKGGRGRKGRNPRIKPNKIEW